MSLESTLRRAARKIPVFRRLCDLHHYTRYRLELGLRNFVESRDQRDPEGGPLPPPRLRHRVHGSLEPSSFLELGQIVARDIIELLHRVDRDLTSFGDVLDFGCGCGKVLRNLGAKADNCRRYATDIDPEAIAWCTKNLEALAQWSVNESRPPLSFEDDKFDFIYAMSVFTHLDEEYQFDWLSELKRIAKPKGILILTVHGATCAEPLIDDEKSILNERGFFFQMGPPGSIKPDGLPDFYQMTYHTREYVEREWSKYFTILDYVERGIADIQDAVIVRNG